MGLVRPTLAQVLKYGRGPYAEAELPWESRAGGVPYNPLTDPVFVATWDPASGQNTLVGSDIEILADLKGGGRSMTALSATQRPEKVASANLNNRDVARFNGSVNDKIRNTTRSLFRLWHDGTGVTMIAIYWIGSGDTAVIWDSNSAGSTPVGATWLHDAGANQRLVARVANGTSAIINFTSANGTAPPGAQIGVFRYLEGRPGNEYDIRLNGVSRSSGDSTAAPATGDSAFDPTFGAQAGANSFNFDGDLGVVLMAAQYLTDTKVAQVEAWSRVNYGTP